MRACMRCRLLNRRLQVQVMGDLTPEQIRECRPFQHVSLDLMGPFMVKGLGGFSRRQFKAWGMVVACTSTKAVWAWAMKGYATEDFLLALSNHCAASPATFPSQARW